MAHPLGLGFVSDVSRAIDLPDPIVEFGSMQVEEGQPNNLRPLFADKTFVGTDLRNGPGVDRIEDLRSLTFADGEVGTALCLDTLEHCTDPLAACREMHRVVADGGVCLISSVMFFGIHAYPSDYWRFTPEGLRVLLGDFDEVDVAGVGHPACPFFVFGLGVKGRGLGVRVAELPALAEAQDSYDRADGKIRIGLLNFSLRELAGTLVSELPRVVRQRTAARMGR